MGAEGVNGRLSTIYFELIKNIILISSCLKMLKEFGEQRRIELILKVKWKK